MRFHLTPPPLLHLLTAILLAPRPATANPRPAASVQSGFTYNELFARYECSGQVCGYSGQLCCPAGSACSTNYLDQAVCGGSASGYASASAAPAQSSGGGGYWVYITTTTVMTNYETITTVYSSYIPGATVSAAASASARCNYALNESPCGDICCAGNQYCAYVGQCSAAAATQTTTGGGGSGNPSQTPGAPIRPTSSGVVVITNTQSPTTTVPFQTPVATGSNVTMTESHSGGGGGLSGGAIAGIVIGVLVGLLILGLICFYCCLKGLLDGCLALFGLGGRKRKRTEVEEYERRTHHSSKGGGRTWYGAAKPSRVDRREKRESNFGRDALGVGAGLAGLWAVLGLKRRHNDKKKKETYSEYSYSSDYYTSASSASSDDRRTRTHRSASRSRR